LIEHPDQLALLREQPDLINKCIEECLRYDAPILFNWRVLREPWQIDDVVIPADAVIWQMLACGNRDPRNFNCLGNMLAKVEARIALGQFAEKTKRLQIEPGATEWSPSFFRVLGSYPVEFK